MISRRTLLKRLLSTAGVLSLPSISGCTKNNRTTKTNGLNSKPDENGLLLPAGYSSRIVARTSQRPVANADFLWHAAPDGGATFLAPDGGWIYVSNSEVPNGGGGVSALRFDAHAKIIDAYAILRNSNRNCAGCKTPWNTYLSCEEVDSGRVWECDPFGNGTPVAVPALGIFSHEAAIVDPVRRHIYLTEDKIDGCLYRFSPNNVAANGRFDLSAGRLELAQVIGGTTGSIQWQLVPDPLATTTATRYQVNQRTSFNGGEGICLRDGIVYFTTKGDNRVWSYDTIRQTIDIYYDDDTHPNPILTGVDNIIVSPTGELVVSEDGGDMQVVAISHNKTLRPLVQITGHNHSEVTGIAFDPSGTRLYLNSQRGIFGNPADAITYEVSGPFNVA